MKKTAKKKSAVAPIRNATELAKLVKKNKSTVGRWLGDDRWQFGPGPWGRDLLPKILEWAAVDLERRSDAITEHERAELRVLRKEKLQSEIGKLRLQSQSAQVELDRARGELLLLADVRRVSMTVASAARNRFLGLPGSVAPRLVGLDAGGIQQVLDEELRTILTALASGLEGVAR